MITLHKECSSTVCCTRKAKILVSAGGLVISGWSISHCSVDLTEADDAGPAHFALRHAASIASAASFTLIRPAGNAVFITCV